MDGLKLIHEASQRLAGRALADDVANPLHLPRPGVRRPPLAPCIYASH